MVAHRAGGFRRAVQHAGSGSPARSRVARSPITVALAPRRAAPRNKLKMGSPFLPLQLPFQAGPYYFSHLTDIMRFALVFKHGGL
jgi:hypothetical protein